MDEQLVLGELALVILAQNHNPSVLNPDFLKYNDIVPRDWELAENPICAGPVSRVVFKNGIMIVADPQRVSFIERASGETIESLCIPKVAERFVKTLPHVKYVSLGVNPKGHILSSSPGDTESFVRDRLLADGPWKAISGVAPAVSTRLAYVLPDFRLNLEVKSADFTPKGGSRQRVVLFSANFHFNVTGADQKERVSNLCDLIGKWRDSLDFYRRLVTDTFMRRGGTP